MSHYIIAVPTLTAYWHFSLDNWIKEKFLDRKKNRLTFTSGRCGEIYPNQFIPILKYYLGQTFRCAVAATDRTIERRSCVR